MDLRRQGNQLEAGLVRLSQNGRMDGYWQGRKGAELIGGALTVETQPLRLPFWLVDTAGGESISAASLTSNVVTLTLAASWPTAIGMSVSGTFTASDDGLSITMGDLLRVGTYGGQPYFSSDGAAHGSPRTADYWEILYSSGQSKYYIQYHRGVSDDVVYSSSSAVTTSYDPSSLAWNSPGLGSGNPTVQAMSPAGDAAYIQVEGLAYATTNPNGIHLVTIVDEYTLTYPLTGAGEVFTIGGGNDKVLSELVDGAVSSILGSCVFSDPSSDDEESIVLATNSVAKLVSLRSPYTVTDLAYPSTETLDAAVELLQAFDRVILFRDGDRPWEWVPGGKPVISSSYVSATGVVTVTCRDHGLKVGDVVTISDIGFSATPTTADPNGSKTVASVTSADVFTFVISTGSGNETYTPNTGKMVADFFTLAPAGAYTQPQTFPITAADVVVSDGLVTVDLLTAGATNNTIKAGDFVTVYQSAAAELSAMEGKSYQAVTANAETITFYAPVGDYNTAATDVFEFGGRFSIGAGFMNMPGAPWGVYFQRRLWVPFWHSPAGTYSSPTYTAKDQHDQIAASDILDPWTYDQIESQFRITAGIADHTVGLQPFYEDALMVLNRNSMHLVVGTQGSLSDTVVKELTREVGCLARKSIVSQGNSVFFLSDNGIYGVGFIEGYNLRGIEEPLSKPIQPIIDRINRTLASKSVGIYFNNRYYLALPLDSQAGAGDATGNNSVVIFNMLNKGWESLDTFGEGNFNILNFHIARAEERNDLYAINEFGGIHKLESSNLPVDTLSFDVLGGASDYSVDSVLQTRSYDFNQQDRKRFSAAQVQCQSDNAAADVVFSFSAEDPDSGAETIGSIVDFLGSELDPNDTANLRMRLAGMRGFMGTLTISANLAGSAPVGRLKVQSVAVDATLTNRQTISQH